MTKFQKELIQALKEIRLSNPAKNIADHMGIGSRDVATGMRALVEMGCVSRTFKKGLAYYRLIRVSPKKEVS